MEGDEKMKKSYLVEMIDEAMDIIEEADIFDVNITRHYIHLVGDWSKEKEETLRKLCVKFEPASVFFITGRRGNVRVFLWKCQSVSI